ncbi:hypothetical protein [Streptomyces sp. NBC_01451]|uniref:hypothetical protein n=1 Tax=Streptomyces sp. NBC_01451 TaxID=2903872 RepID=UPI002E300369|nr:hypothetical protein [Streptomyces sp. NBC_01451]
MSTWLAPTAACIGTFVLLMHLTTAGVPPSHLAAASRTGLSRLQRVIGDVAPGTSAVFPGVCGPAAGQGTVTAH